MLYDESIKSFLEKTASHSPLVPSGGSVLTLCASSVASLIELCANSTIDKKGYESVKDKMISISKRASKYRLELQLDIDKDADAFAAINLAKSVILSSLNNVLINIDYIKNEVFKNNVLKEVKFIEKSMQKY